MTIRWRLQRDCEHPDRIGKMRVPTGLVRTLPIWDVSKCPACGAKQVTGFEGAL